MLIFVRKLLTIELLASITIVIFVSRLEKKWRYRVEKKMDRIYRKVVGES